MRNLLVAILAGLMLGTANAQSPLEAEWLIWRAGVENDIGASRDAVLKAVDAIYLKDGQAAYVRREEDDFLFSLTERKNAVAEIRLEGGKAMMRRASGKTDLTTAFKDDQYIALSTRFDLDGGPTEIAPGETGFRVVLYDQASLAAKEFITGEWFEFSRAMAFEADFRPAKKIRKRVVETERGLAKLFYHVGDAVFEFEGATRVLPLFSRESDPAAVKNLFTSFTDETTGAETYSVGRYIDLEIAEKFPPKKVTIDFNRAYNPYCARSPHYNCPRAMANIDAPIRAGEKTPK